MTTATTSREQQARDAAAAYDGDFEFMVAMRERVSDPRPLTDRQVTAILRSAARERPQPAAPTSRTTDPVTEPGMYASGDEIFKVQRSRESGQLYAKRLVKIGGRRLSEDDAVVNWEFEYARGAVYRLSASDRMTHDEAVAFGIRYGICCVCGAHLRDATSVAEGIGPVCGRRI